MTVELLQTLSMAAYIAAGVLLLTAVALFFLLDVPKLYGDVSGRRQTERQPLRLMKQTILKMISRTVCSLSHAKRLQMTVQSMMKL